MSMSKKDLDPAFQGAGQKAGIEIWRIENLSPAPVASEMHGKFFTGDSYVVLKTTALKSGAFRHDIHYWLGTDTSQDEAGAAAIKAVELDALLGGRAVQYRELQGHETEKFLSYFKPCIIPVKGGFSSGFKHVEAEEYQTRLYVCRGKHVVHVKEVPFARSSLNHDDIFILDTESKIFQFNGSNSCIQERAKALEVVQYVKDAYHDGKCEIASIEDGKLMADAATGEFWGVFGGFAPLQKKAHVEESSTNDAIDMKLFCVEKGKASSMEVESLTREILDSRKCYILDCGIEIFIWIGRNTSLDERKAASNAADELIRTLDRSKSHVVRVTEGHETVMFRSKFGSWPQPNNETECEGSGKGKVASMLRRQGVNVKGLVKTESPKAETQPSIDCTGDLQVWRVNGLERTLLADSDQFKLYTGDCYIFQYSYPGEVRPEYLIGTWIGKHSVEEDSTGATSQATKMVEEMKFIPAQAHIHEGHEPLLFFAIFQSFILFKGGLSDAYKNYISEKGDEDDTYSEDGLALFQVQGSGPDNMQAIQVEPKASSLNSSYSYILHNGSTVLTWSGSLTTPEDQELVERQLDIIKPNMPSRYLKEGVENEQFWELLGGKTEYSNRKISRVAENDPHLFSCTLANGDLKVTEVYNFNQDDLMTEDVFILNCRSDIYVWVGQQVELKSKKDALSLGKKFLEIDVPLERLSPHTPIYVVTEGNEPAFFTRFFTWDATKSTMHGNSFQRKLAILKNGGTPVFDKARRRAPVPFGARSATQEKPLRSRSVSVFSNDRPRVRGKSPAFHALASKFESTKERNLSTPPPLMPKLYPRSASDSDNPTTRSTAISALTASFQQSGSTSRFLTPRSTNTETRSMESMGDMMETKPETIEEDAKEAEDSTDEEGLPNYPYERLVTNSTDPIEGIDVTRRERYLNSQEFQDKLGMKRSSFYKLPKWKQNKIKSSVHLF